MTLSAVSASKKGRSAVCALVCVALLCAANVSTVFASWTELFEYQAPSSGGMDIRSVYDFCCIGDSLRVYGADGHLVSHETYFTDYCVGESEPERRQQMTQARLLHDHSVIAVVEGRDCNIDGYRACLYRYFADGAKQRLSELGMCAPISPGRAGLAYSVEHPGQLWFGFGDAPTIYKSSDTGKTLLPWSKAPYDREDDIDCGNGLMGCILEVDPLDTTTVYVSGRSADAPEVEVLYRTTDNGVHWDSVFAFAASSVRQVRHRRLSLDLYESGGIALLLDSAVYYSSNRGTTWELKLSGCATYCVGRVPWSSEKLAVGLDSGRIWGWSYLTLPTSAPVTGLLIDGSFLVAFTQHKAYGYWQSLDVPLEKPISGMAAYPNPSAGDITFRFPHNTTPYELTIVDVLGTPVRHLGEHQAGSSVVWDGRNDTGNSVPAGTYFGLYVYSERRFRLPVVKY